MDDPWRPEFPAQKRRRCVSSAATEALRRWGYREFGMGILAVNGIALQALNKPDPSLLWMRSKNLAISMRDYHQLHREDQEPLVPS